MGWPFLIGFCTWALYKTAKIVGRERNLGFVRENFFALLFCVTLVGFASAAAISAALT